MYKASQEKFKNVFCVVSYNSLKNLNQPKNLQLVHL